MSNILFFTFNELIASNGISKKIKYQKKAIENNGNRVYLMYIQKENTNISLYIDKEKIVSYKYNFLWTFKILSLEQPILNFIKKYNIDCIYVRYTQFASPSICNLFKRIQAIDVNTILEIPTYPYDCEFKGTKKILGIWEKFWRKRLAKHINSIVTFTQIKYIWKIPTLQIKNGVDFSEIVLKRKNEVIQYKVELIAVAGIAFWHGFDRIIEGLHHYYNNKVNNKIEVHLNIIGKGDINVYNSLVDLVNKYSLNDYVTFYGEMYGKALDELFETADIAIGCLGCHRKNIKEVSSLKNVEYAARGIPFIYSEINKDFDNKPYVKKEKPDDSPINIMELVEWRKNLVIEPIEIRNTIVDSLSWEKQMDTVFNR